MKAVFVIFVFIFIAASNQSCVVVNATKHKDNVCYLHRTKMKKTIVKTHYGFASLQNDPLSPNAKMKYSMGCVVPLWPSGRLAIVYHCSKCDSISHH